MGDVSEAERDRESAGDSPMLLPMLEQLLVNRPIDRPRTRPDVVRGGKAYSSRAIRSHLKNRGIKAVIPEPRDRQGHRKRRGSHGGRPVGLDAADHKSRNVIERRFCHTRQWRGLATRYGKHAIVYRAAVLIHATRLEKYIVRHALDLPLYVDTHRRVLGRLLRKAASLSEQAASLSEQEECFP